jgi:hypothetical protein
MRRIWTAALVAASVAAGWVGATVQSTASAQVSPPTWSDVGEVNGVSVYRIDVSGRTCVVTTPAGGIACTR